LEVKENREAKVESKEDKGAKEDDFKKRSPRSQGA
jgi:hypothetical protein